MKPKTLFVIFCGAVSLMSVITSCKKDKHAPDDKSLDTHNIAYYAKIEQHGDGKANKKTTAISDGKVTWTAATTYMDEIVFEGNNGTVQTIPTAIQKNVNLFGTESFANEISFPAGQYTNTILKLRLKKSQNSEQAFFIEGKLDGTNTSIVIGNSDPFEIKLPATDVTISADKKYRITLNYDLSKLLNGITSEQLANATRIVNTDIIMLSSSSNIEMFNTVKNNWTTLTTAEFVED